MTQHKGKNLSKFLAKKESHGVPVPLQDCVIMALEKYFDELNGYPATDLHAIILAEVETPLLKITLHHVNGNQSRAAKILGMSRSTLRKKLKLYGLT